MKDKITLKHDGWLVVADGEKALFLRNEGDEKFPNLEVFREEEQDNPPNREQAANRRGRFNDGPNVHRSAVDDTQLLDDLAGIDRAPIDLLALAQEKPVNAVEYIFPHLFLLPTFTSFSASRSTSPAGRLTRSPRREGMMQKVQRLLQPSEILR